MTQVPQKVFEAVVQSAPHISEGMLHRREHAGEQNPSDEEVREADVWANELLKEKITGIEGVGQFASEEEKYVTDCGEGVSVAIDPLDGSSNIPTNNLVGTIVGIYDKELPANGEHLIEAFYVVYGPVTSIIRSDGEKVEEYVVESHNDQGEAIKVGENLSLPEAKVYGFGGNKEWYDNFEEFENELNDEFKLRYGGALVGDVNQVIHHGGVFGYPAKESAPEGKLRKQFEAFPMALILETMNSGASSNGELSMMESEIEELHERTPLFLGNETIVSDIEENI